MSSLITVMAKALHIELFKEKEEKQKKKKIEKSRQNKRKQLCKVAMLLCSHMI